MKKNFLLAAVAVMISMTLSARGVKESEEVRYIDVVGTAETIVVPDEIHFIISIKEYFAEEFDGLSKPEEYKTKVPMASIEKGLRDALYKIGVKPEDIRTEEVGDYWRERGKDFLISKNLNITLSDFNTIDKIIGAVDTRGVNYMRIGELQNKDILKYHEECRVEAVKAAKRKAEYLLAALGEKVGKVLYIQDTSWGPDSYSVMRSNANFKMESAAAMDAAAPVVSASDAFRVIKVNHSISVRFEIAD